MSKKPFFLILTLIGCFLVGFTVFQLSGIFFKNNQNSNTKISSVLDSASTTNSLATNSLLEKSSSSSTQSIQSVPSTLKNWQTYTNPLFPTLKIAYPDTWKFNSTTANSRFAGLLDRDSVITNKEGFEFHIITVPMIATGCSGNPEEAKITEFKKLDNNIYKTRYFSAYQNKSLVHYSSSPVEYSGCELTTIKSNIDSSTIPDFKASFSDKSKVEFFIKTTEIDDIPANSNLIKELDEILAKSQF
jgi:hypothetical protein